MPTEMPLTKSWMEAPSGSVVVPETLWLPLEATIGVSMDGAGSLAVMGIDRVEVHLPGTVEAAVTTAPFSIAGDTLTDQVPPTPTGDVPEGWPETKTVTVVPGSAADEGIDPVMAVNPAKAAPMMGTGDREERSEHTTTGGEGDEARPFSVISAVTVSRAARLTPAKDHCPPPRVVVVPTRFPFTKTETAAPPFDREELPERVTEDPTKSGEDRAGLAGRTFVGSEGRAVPPVAKVTTAITVFPAERDPTWLLEIPTENFPSQATEPVPERIELTKM